VPMVTVVAATTAAMNNVLSRPAKVGDKLVTHNFGTGTGGFADAAEVLINISVPQNVTAGLLAGRYHDSVRVAVEGRRTRRW